MGRPARFSSDQIVAATAQVAARHGPAGASIARIAETLKAPTGSIYHRFGSRDMLLGEVWLRAAEAFQQGAVQRLSDQDPIPAGVATVRHVPSWVRANSQQARILLLHRREDFIDQGWPDVMSARAHRLRENMSRCLRQYARRLTGRANARSLQIVSYAVAQAPLAAVRPYIEAEQSLPAVVDDLVEVTFRASISLCTESR